MPRYTWLCKKCGKEEIVDANIVDRDVPPKVESDCEHEFTRLIDGGNFILKGNNWYSKGGY